MVISHQPVPVVQSLSECVDWINPNHSSLARFGDDEILIMEGHSISYQDYNPRLADELLHILYLQSDENFLVGISDIFEDLERYTVPARFFWAAHYETYKDFYAKHLNSSRYATCFLSRPYIDLVDKSKSVEHFSKIKSLWSNRDILIVEGGTSRSGVGNDLFHNAQSISRIICPSRNAYSKFSQIFKKVKEYGKDKLILFMLGPTAKVLAYNLYKEVFHALDIGHIDSEY